MDKMKALNKGAHDWLEKMPPNTWVKAFFSEYPKCDILLNNCCEVFNSYILEARELPILTMLQRIKSQLMTRHYNKQKELAENWQGLEVCPKIRKKIERNAEFANTCYVLPAGQGIFEVQDRDIKYSVDIIAKHCDYRRWDLSGIPCSHAISCLRHDRIPQESVVPHCYTIQAFQMAYANNIMPCADQSTWEYVGGIEVKPPIYEKKVGRPPKARRRAPYEVQGSNGPKLSKHGVEMHCSHCRGTGHNIATCQRKQDGFPATELHDQQEVPHTHTHIRRRNTKRSLHMMKYLKGFCHSFPHPWDEVSAQPLPDSSYILANLPPARAAATTTATKAGQAKKRKAYAPRKQTGSPRMKSGAAKKSQVGTKGEGSNQQGHQGGRTKKAPRLSSDTVP
ncbi:hypothetical protein U9M48_026868 [Paspalum notatum var. saurae]|uniref:Zinc finger PMZ-type domain-containing protein n=1 Tax=Paspalum notatum var. saurae TaxID=547442 RepID=A0AAQ3TW64_PASNO